MAQDALRVLYRRLVLSSSQFRLLRLRSNDDGSISHYTLGRYEVGVEGLSYLAVSYTWGSQPFNRIINVNGIEVKVTRGCSDALMAIKCNFRNRWLIWVDQLCIGQENLQERGAQVLLMSSIYSRAEQVLVWLDEFEELTCGLGDEPNLPGRRQSDSGAEELRRFLEIREDPQRYQFLQQEVKDTKALVGFLGEYYRGYIHPGAAPVNASVSEIPTSTKAWDHLLAILRHRYFRRRWILQEIGMKASKAFIILETDILLVDSLNDCSQQVDLIMDGYCRVFDELLAPEVLAEIRQGSGLGHLGQVFRITHDTERKGGIGLMPLLMHCEAFETIDPLDRVYAPRALTTDVDVPDPDYTLTIKKLLLTLAKRFIIKGEAGTLLAHSGLVHHDGPSDIPSWCPLWIEYRSTRTLSSAYNTSDLRAAGTTAPQVNGMDTDETLLKVHGAAIDNIQTVTDGGMIGFTNGPFSIHLSAIETLRASAPQQTMGRAELEHLLSSFEQTIDSDPPYSRFMVSHSSAIETLLQLLSPNVPMENLHISNQAENTRLWHLLVNLQWSRWLDSRCFCVTTKGFVGIAPRTGVRVGDLVAVLAGVHVTMILRPNPDRAGTFQIVSNSYFMGLGKGEAMENGLYAENERDFTLS